MTSDARQLSQPTFLLAAFQQLVRDELAPYAGRAAVVARIVIVSTVAMIVTMTFRIPYGVQSAVYTLMISRESPRSTVRAATTILVVLAVATAHVLIGAMLSLGDPTLRLLWVIGSLFVAFFAISAMADYVAAISFAILLGLTLPLWNEPVPPELKVSLTLWAAGQTIMGCVLTMLVELAFAAFRPRNDLLEPIAERLTAVEAFVASLAEGRPTDGAAQKLARLGKLGTSHLQQFLARSAYSPPYAERMGVVVALTGRLVDLAVNLTTLDIEPSPEDVERMRRLAEDIARIRADLLLERVPGPRERPRERDASHAVPLLRELEITVSLIPEAAAGAQSADAYAAPLPGDRRSRLFAFDALSNAEHVRFALKGCLAASLCYIIYTGVNWPGISTAVVTCLLTALTTIGASRQKQVLRIAGATAGGMVAIGAQVFILPHVDSIGGFTVLFVTVVTAAAWMATSSPRLSYFGVQLVTAFYLVHLQEFAMQTSLAVARDRLVGILLGLFMMWIVFDRLWGSPAGVAMKKEMIATLRRLALFVREPLTTDTRAAVDRIRALRETINGGFDTVRALGDGVLFEFGPTREADLAWRHRFLAWQAPLRLAFLTRVVLVKYRLGVPGFQLPPAVGSALTEFDRELAKRFDNMADRLELGTSKPDALEQALARLEQVSRSQASPHTLLPLSRRIASLTASLHEDVLSGLNGA